MSLTKLVEVFVTGFTSEAVFVAPECVNYFMASKPGQVGKTILTLADGTTVAVQETPEEVFGYPGFDTFCEGFRSDASGPKHLDNLPVWFNVEAVKLVRPDRGRKLSTLEFSGGPRLHLKEHSLFV